MTTIEPEGTHRIVVGIDGSPASVDALEWAAPAGRAHRSPPRGPNDLGMADQLRLVPPHSIRIRPRT